MKILKKLPAHLLHTEQAGAKFAPLYAAISKLGIGGALEVNADDVGAQSFEKLVDICHSVTRSLQVRKGAMRRFSVRRDREAELVYIVRNEDRLPEAITKEEE